ncbi:hypothetical protein CEP54_015454 [Fusarium duplospermum]|uniref:Uncharacterized protein n=1 Tax=Fusarium duplospermum TaxID=1325734 RepID=A0A428NP34_9HYPO|nr:hypothetical protein CEP54_015454 [Fusarium duplospermum]
MHAPKPTLAMKSYPHMPSGHSAIARMRSRHARSPCVDLRRLQKQQTKTIGELCNDDAARANTQGQLAIMTMGSEDGETGQMGGRGNSDPLIPKITIHPPTADDDDINTNGKDQDVETLCAKIEAHLQGTVETVNSRDSLTLA